MQKRQQIGRKLAKVFLLQLGFISLAALSGVYAAKRVLEGILIQQALRDEAEHFWDHYRTDPGFPLPDTRNMKAYLWPGQNRQEVPSNLRELPAGFHELAAEGAFSIVYVTQSGDPRLILVFDGTRVEQLALFFGMIPLSGALIGIYIATLIGYHLSRRAVSPVIWLARQVGHIDRDSPDEGLLALERLQQLPDGADDEVRALAEALARLSSRLRLFIERERRFTRDVSHELRSPITVIRLAADVLAREASLAPWERSNLDRIRRAVRDMEELTEVFLLLARESDQPLPPGVTVCVNDIAWEEYDRAQHLLAGKAVDVSIAAAGRLQVGASEKVLSTLLGNLIRNAFAYTQAGYVRIHITEGQLLIEDSGSGITSEYMTEVFKPYVRGTRQGQGHGVGLDIVKRFCDRFHWPIDIQSEAGHGTRITVRFPGARWEASSEP